MEDQEIRQLKNELAGKEAYIAELENRIAEQQETINRLSNTLTAIKQGIKHPLTGVKAALKFMKERHDRLKKLRKPAEVFRLDYEEWIVKQEQYQAERNERERESGAPLSYQPKISVLMPVYNMEDRFLVPCIEAVLAQTYENWELCISDDHSSMESVHRTLERYAGNPNIRISYREENGNISENTNSALAMATGEYVAFLDCDDLLAPEALYEVVKYLNQKPETDMLYSDEDKIDADGKHRHDPFFKPDWSPDTLMSMMYTCHLGVYRTALVRELGGLRKEYDGAQDYDLVLRLMEKTERIGHVDRILYHWRESATSTASGGSAKPYAVEAARRAKEDALSRRHLCAVVESDARTGYCQVNYVPQEAATVSIVIPSKDHYDILKRCVESLTRLTAYTNYELIIVDNGSCEEQKTQYELLAGQVHAQYIYWSEKFNFSAMCNRGAARASGAYLLFLNDDTEITDGRWLGRMLGQAEQKHVGAVGAKLLYPGTGHIQHCGVLLIHNGPSHALSNFTDDRCRYFGRNEWTYDYAAVTGACLLVNAEKFREIGGFDETFPVAYNDVDLCLRLLEHGYYNVVRNDVTLLHYESVSRGYDLNDEAGKLRLGADLEHLWNRHPQYEKADPFYSRNLSPHAYDFSYSYALEKAETVNPVELDPTDGKLTTSETGVVGHVDCIRDEGEFLSIEGWCYDEKLGAGTEYPIRVILKGMEHSYELDPNRIARPDIVLVAGEKQQAAYCGFYLKLCKKELPQGQYEMQIGIHSKLLSKTWKVSIA